MSKSLRCEAWRLPRCLGAACKSAPPTPIDQSSDLRMHACTYGAEHELHVLNTTAVIAYMAGYV